MQPQQIEVLKTLAVPIYIRHQVLASWRAQHTENAEVVPTATKQQVKDQAANISKTSIQRQRHVSITQQAIFTHNQNDIPQFSIAMLVCKEALVVFDCGEQTDIERMLIERMIVRCGCNLIVEPFVLFRWPMVHSDQVTQSTQAATAALMALVKQKVTDSHVPEWLVLCGNDAKRYFPSDSWQTKVVYLSNSAHDMVHNPELRKPVWNALQSLRSAIGNQATHFS